MSVFPGKNNGWEAFMSTNWPIKRVLNPFHCKELTEGRTVCCVRRDTIRHEDRQPSRAVVCVFARLWVVTWRHTRFHASITVKSHAVGTLTYGSATAERLVKAVTLYTYTREILGLDLDWETPAADKLRGTNLTRLQLHTSKLLSIHR
jgi:hypothetical protein